MLKETTAAVVPLSPNGGQVVPISPAIQRMLDRTEDDVVAIEEAFLAIADAHDRLRRRSIAEQIDTVRETERKLETIDNAPTSIHKELCRQMHAYTTVQGAMMDQAEEELSRQWQHYLAVRRSKPSRMRRLFGRFGRGQARS